MQVTRLRDARLYKAPGHFEVSALRLQGMEASDAGFAWVGLSHFLPGGGCEMDASPLAKVYVVIAGKIEIQLASGETETLSALDSCYIPGGESRSIRNPSNMPASMIVVMPPPPGDGS